MRTGLVQLITFVNYAAEGVLPLSCLLVSLNKGNYVPQNFSFQHHLEPRGASHSVYHAVIFIFEYRSSACLRAGSSCALRQSMGSLGGEKPPSKDTPKQLKVLSPTLHSVSLVGMQTVSKISGRLLTALDFIVVDLS